MRGRGRKKVSKGSQGEQGLELTHAGIPPPQSRGRTREANLVPEAQMQVSRGSSAEATSMMRRTLVGGPVKKVGPPGPRPLPAANTSECPPLHSTPIFKV